MGQNVESSDRIARKVKVGRTVAWLEGLNGEEVRQLQDDYD